MADLAREANLDIVGQVDNVVYYERLGIKTQRAHFIPVQPGTQPQLDWWQIFRTGVQQWQALTPIQKTTYNQKAKRLHMSGFNLYMREWLNSQA
jgi:hypothetical protein